MAGITQSLFGISPETLEAQRRQAIDAEAMKYAELDPMQRATFSIYSGSRRLADGIGGMLGAQDPELARITSRQKMLQGLDPTDPEALKAVAAQAMQSGDYPAAQELLARAKELEAHILEMGVKNSTIAKNLREKAGVDPIQKLLQTGKYVPASVQKYAQTGNAEDLETIDKDEVVVETQEGVFLVKKSTGQKIERIGSPVKRGTEINMPGEQVKPKEWLPFIEHLDKSKTYKASTDIISMAPGVLETIRMSTDNDFAAAALSTQLAKLSGETGTLSNQDISRFARVGGLDDRLIGSAVSFFSGRATNEKKDQAERYVTAVFRGALLEKRRELVNKAKELGYSDTPNYAAALESIDTQLARFKPRSGSKPSETPATSTLSAAEQAELEELRKRFKGKPSASN